MKVSRSLILSMALLASIPYTSEAKKSQSEIRNEIHSELLANAKNGIDKSVIRDYIKNEIIQKEEAEVPSLYQGLSSESIEMISDLLGEAKSHTGKRYGRGSKGPDRFDCSGFTSYVYKQFGYKLDASSSGQYSDGVKVDNGQLRPGDLVFFTGRNSKGRVGHVGIVVTCDNENHTFTFIHAAISGGIRTDNSTAPYYAKRYVGARRIITE